jgi:hypothetical protein
MMPPRPLGVVLAQLLLIGVFETDPDGVSLQRVLEDSLIALRFGNHDCALVDDLVRCLETDPLTDPVIVEGLGPLPALKREGKGRGLVNAFPRQRLLGLRPGEASIHCRGDQLFAGQLRGSVCALLREKRITRCGGPRVVVAEADAVLSVGFGSEPIRQAVTKARISEHPSSTMARRVNLAIRPSFLSNAEQS